MSGKTSKAKGKRGELECAAEFRAYFSCNARRGVQYHGGADSPDVITDIPGLHIEAKRTERLSLYSAKEQSSKDAGEDVPVVWHKANRKKSLFACYMEDLPRLVVLLYHTMKHRNSGLE
jgi:hypothetical protein